jgi:flagellar hook assembly protein FlgD
MKVSISIYNAVGQLVESLVNKNQKAGSHSVIWDASSISSGLYFYRIEAGEYAESKKCLLLK